MTSGPIEQQLRDLLNAGMAPHLLVVENESHQHSVPPGSETHFKVLLVSDRFDGLPRVRRHQAVYGAVAELMNQPIHALALHLYSPREWESREAAVPESPRCLGGSKNDPMGPRGSAQ